MTAPAAGTATARTVRPGGTMSSSWDAVRATRTFLTVGARRALRTAGVLLYDHLAALACLAETKPGAVLVDVVKILRGCQTTQTDDNSLLVEDVRPPYSPRPATREDVPAACVATMA